MTESVLLWHSQADSKRVCGSVRRGRCAAFFVSAFACHMAASRDCTKGAPRTGFRGASSCVNDRAVVTCVCFARGVVVVVADSGLASAIATKGRVTCVERVQVAGVLVIFIMI